jgi:regulator of sigma E protease
VGLSSFLPGILLLGIVIFFHELGHFLAAKWRRVTVLKFSLGMGPELIGFTRGGTRYCVSWIPLGGFVQMAGDHLADDGSMPEGGPEQFLTHPWYGRIVIAVAGPAANLVTAFAVLVLTFLLGVHQPDWPSRLGPLPDTTRAYAAGLREGDELAALDGHTIHTWRDLDDAGSRALEGKRPVSIAFRRDSLADSISVPAADARAVLGDLQPPPPPAEVGGVGTGMPAYRAGVKEGDKVLAVNGKPVHTFQEIARALRGRADQPTPITFEREGKVFDLTIAPMRMDGNGDVALIGIEPPRGMEWVQKLPFTQAVPAAFRGTGDLVANVYGSLWLTITRPAYYRESIGGPIFIGQMASDSAKHGLDRWLYLLALINVAIMAFNLLPVPLPGRRPHHAGADRGCAPPCGVGRTYMNFQKVGLVLVGTLFVFILSKDLARPFQRLRAVDKAPRETTTVAPDPH